MYGVLSPLQIPHDMSNLVWDKVKSRVGNVKSRVGNVKPRVGVRNFPNT